MTMQNTKMVLVLLALSTYAVGCGQSTTNQSNATHPVINTGEVPISPDGVYTSNGSYSDSQKTATFTPVSIEEMNSYVGTHPLNDPKDFKVSVDLKEVPSQTGRYYGTVKISYTDTGVRYTGTFKASSNTNEDLYNLKDSGTLDAEYNRWFTINNVYYFSAYFQDAYGAIVLIFDNYVNQGDAQGTGVVSGSIYYKNFAQSYAPQSPYRSCWFIYAGPYNCISSAVTNKSAVYPGDGYIKLGTFSGMSKAAVFNN